MQSRHPSNGRVALGRDRRNQCAGYSRVTHRVPRHLSLNDEFFVSVSRYRNLTGVADSENYETKYKKLDPHRRHKD